MIFRQRTSWSRRIVSLLTCIVVGWFIYDIGMNVVVWHFIQRTSKNNPNLGVVPIPLSSNSQVNLHGIQLKAFEYSLRVPWDDLETRKDAASLAIWYFKNGASVTLFYPSTTDQMVSLLRHSEDPKKVEHLLGGLALSSDYDLLAAELNAAPSQIHWWSSRASKARISFLLNMKAMEILQARVIHPQSFGEMRGFQFGDPALPPYKIELDLFDRNGRRYRIWILKKDANHSFITQAELNALVSSLTPIPHS